MVRRSKIRILVAGSLIIALLIAFAPWFSGRSPPAAPPSNVSNSVPAKLRTLVKPPALLGPQSRPDNIHNVEICGFGKVALDAADPLAAADFVGEKAKGSAEKWLSALLNNDDYRARAAGLFLEGKINGAPKILPMTEQARNALVQLAVGAQDPAVYAIALYACGGNFGDPPDGTCRQVSAEGWARMEPDNAVPWLLLARQARDKHDSSAEADAFSRAAKAHGTNSYNSSLYAFAEPELPIDATPAERWYLAVQLIGIEAAIRQDQYGVASKYCSTDPMQDGGVRQQCDSLAELWATQGTTLLDFSFGTSLGARIGWPAQKVNRLRMERDAMMQAGANTTPMGKDDFWSCKGLQSSVAHLNLISRLGEMGAGRDSLDRSGETVPELAQKWADYMEKIRHEAELRNSSAPPDVSP